MSLLLLLLWLLWGVLFGGSVGVVCSLGGSGGVVDNKNNPRVGLLLPMVRGEGVGFVGWEGFLFDSGYLG